MRVVQGYEPRHFLKIFKGKLITYIDNDVTGKTHLFRVRGTCAEDVRADELPSVAASLASDDVSILKTNNKAYIWNGIVSFASKVLYTRYDYYYITQLCYLDLFYRVLRNSKKKWVLLSLILLLPILIPK